MTAGPPILGASHVGYEGPALARARCKPKRKECRPGGSVHAGSKLCRTDWKKRRLDEPQPEGDDWVEFGGERIWAMGFTEGGCPYGLSLEEFRGMNEEADQQAGWALAKHVLSPHAENTRRRLGGFLRRTVSDR